jgi:hypothetical protein
VVQVLATNGYRTSYVQTRYFEVPVKPPEVLVGEAAGPVLFAQGFSLQDGALSGDNVVWLIDGGSSRSGGSLDVRTLGPGIHQVSVRVRDFAGGQRTSQARQLLLIRLFQQTTRDSVEGCRGRRFRGPCGNSIPTASRALLG